MGVQSKITTDDDDDAPLVDLAKLARQHAEALERKRILMERSACMASLKTFTQMVWRNVMHPGTPLKWNWHLDVMCETLEAVHAGEVQNVIINVPPRSSKTSLVSVCFQIWVWLHDPSQQFLCVAHSGKKARADAVKARNVMRSQWFQEHFGDIFQFALDTNSKERYETNHGGHRLSYGVTTMLAGENADYIIIDDPHDPESAQSDAERASVLDNYDDSISQRLNDPMTGKIIIVMQRLHPQDLCGHVLANSDKDEWLHLMFAMEYEPDHPFLSATCKQLDPRTKVGELLWPDRFPAAYVKRRRKKMTPLGYSGQHQQRPTPATGSILKKNWWVKWPSDIPIPEMEYVLHSWDTAYEADDLKKNARSALTSWGIFWNEKKNRWCIMLLRGFAQHLEYPDLRRIAKKLTVKDNPDMVLIEKKASGISLIQDFRRAGVPAVKYNPDRDKIARAYAIQPMFESGMVYYPEGKRWAEEVISEAADFPYGIYKDYVDTISQAMLRIRDMNEFEHPDDEDKDEDDQKERMRRKPFGGEKDEDFEDDARGHYG